MQSEISRIRTDGFIRNDDAKSGSKGTLCFLTRPL